MRLGALLAPRRPADLAEQARSFEGEGFDSLWSAHAMGRGFLLLDPFVALSVAAAVTKRVELGTAILQIPIYNPTDIALKALSLHQVSGERFVLGVGAGSTDSDYLLHGEDFAGRFHAFDSSINRLRDTLREGSANGGSLGASGGPPLYFGTWGRNVARAAAEFDGWIASGMHRTPAECARALTGYRERGGSRAIVSTIRVLPGTDLGELRDILAAYADAGFDDAVVMILSDAAPSAVRRLVD